MVEDPSPCYKLLALHMMANITDSKQLDVLEFLAKCSGPRRSFLCFNRNKQILLIKMNFHWDFLVRLAPIPLWSLTITYLVGFSHLKLSFSFFFHSSPRPCWKFADVTLAIKWWYQKAKDQIFDLLNSRWWDWLALWETWWSAWSFWGTLHLIG